MLPDGFTLIHDFIERPQVNRLFEALERGIRWQSDHVRLYGREHPIPRLHQWYADPGLTYRWSGLSMQPCAWIDELTALRSRLEFATGAAFNSVLANLYRDGNDAMGWHADDEPELGPEPVIASLSFGAPRDFKLRRRDGQGASITVELPPGSLLLMSGESQSVWQHALPRRRRVTAPRINLTFRRILG